MHSLESIRRFYSRLIRTPRIGPLVAGPVRFAKRMFIDATPRLETKLDLAIAASAGMRSELDATSRRQRQLEAEIELLRLTIAQQSALLETLARSVAPTRREYEAALARVVVRAEWQDGVVREVNLPFESPERRLNGKNVAALHNDDDESRVERRRSRAS